MTKIIKNLLGATLAVTVLALAYAAVKYVNYYGQVIEPSSFRSFSVTSDAKVTAIPDVAEFNFQIITEGGKDMTALQTKNTEVSNKVIAFLKDQGVNDKDIKTQSYNVNPRYETSNCRIIPGILTPETSLLNNPVNNGLGGGGSVSSDSYNISVGAPSISISAPSSILSKTCPPPAIVGYTISQSINVKVRDFNKIGDIMGGIVTNGSNEVGSLSFTIDDPTKIQDEARTKAISKARLKAEAIASAGGFSVGRLLGIQEGFQYPIYSASPMMKGLGGGNDSVSVAPIIQPGSQEISVTVTLQYEIK